MPHTHGVQGPGIEPHDDSVPPGHEPAPAAGPEAARRRARGPRTPEGVEVKGPEAALVASGHDREASLGFRPTRVAGRPAVEIVGPDETLAGYYAALHAALAAAADPADDDPDGSGPAPVEPPESIVLRLDRSPGGAPRVRLAGLADDDLWLLSQAEVVGAVGSWELLVPSGAMRWSENLFRIYGFDPRAPTPTLEELFAALHPADRERVAREVAELQQQGTLDRPIRQRIVRPSGEVRHLRGRLGVVETDADGAPRRLVGTVQDVTERLRAEQEIETHLAVAEGLAEWQALEPSAQHLLCRLGEAMGGVGGVLWVPEDGHLVARIIWPDPSSPLEAYWTATRRTRLRPGACVPGAAWQRGEPVFVVGGTSADYGPRWRAAQEDGLRGTVAIPALNGADVVAVVEMAFLEHASITERLVRSLTGIGHELGQFFARRQGELGAARLTARELEVLRLTSEGMATRATADALFISPATVKTHLSNVYEKLGVTDRAAAVATALRLGLIR